jgi:leucyl-tRNA synthetase
MSEKYGVDTLRAAIMFGAPPESDLNFDENSVQSMKGFLDRIAKFSKSCKEKNFFISEEELILANAKRDPNLMKNITENLLLLADWESQISSSRHFHVSIARLMELFNKI